MCFDHRKFTKVKRFLRKKYPVAAPVFIRFCDKTELDKTWSKRYNTVYADYEQILDSEQKITSFRIRIRRGMGWVDTLKALAHEWAHCHRDYAPSNDKTRDHDKIFGALEKFFEKELLAHFL